MVQPGALAAGYPGGGAAGAAVAAPLDLAVGPGPAGGGGGYYSLGRALRDIFVAGAQFYLQRYRPARFAGSRALAGGGRYPDCSFNPHLLIRLDRTPTHPALRPGRPQLPEDGRTAAAALSLWPVIFVLRPAGGLAG